MTDHDARLAALEARLTALEDEAAITRLVLSYGPLVDSGEAEQVADLWTAEGVYDVDELLMRGQEEIASMVTGDRHQGWIKGGCAHFLGAPHVRVGVDGEDGSVDSDRAVAVCHSLMLVHDAETNRFSVRRATANLWRLHRTSDGWRVTERTSRVLDGRPESPRLLADGVAGVA